MIISPLNYPGNKARILKYILPLFPRNINHFVDVFCGSGITSLNSDSQTITLNDKENKIIELLQFFKNENLETILEQTNVLIKQYDLTESKNKPKGYYKIYKNEGLSKYNKQGFLALRESYNKHPSPIQLFVLLIYGFNHYMRFNNLGAFNVPVGKMDFSETLYNKTIDFIVRLKNKNILFKNLDFKEESLYKNGDFFYFDPPYFITNAPYNASWSKQDELDLYALLDFLHSKGVRFALSNVLYSNGKENALLKQWSEKYRTIPIKRQYTNANYRRKNLSESLEVLIINY